MEQDEFHVAHAYFQQFCRSVAASLQRDRQSGGLNETRTTLRYRAFVRRVRRRANAGRKNTFFGTNATRRDENDTLHGDDDWMRHAGKRLIRSVYTFERVSGADRLSGIAVFPHDLVYGTVAGGSGGIADHRGRHATHPRFTTVADSVNA
jgi:hypothetical protein